MDGGIVDWHAIRCIDAIEPAREARDILCGSYLRIFFDDEHTARCLDGM